MDDQALLYANPEVFGKVIIPGTLPMTFGHHNRRPHDLPRLYEVPPGLGYPRPDGINPYPHPFP
jgi:ribosomal protein S12 methylthiotransferase accessory factor